MFNRRSREYGLSVLEVMMVGYDTVPFPKGQPLVTGAAGFIGSNLVEALLRWVTKCVGWTTFLPAERECSRVHQ